MTNNASAASADSPRQTGPRNQIPVAEVFAPRFVPVLVGSVVVLLLGLWGFIATDLHREREIHLAQAQRDTENLSIAFEHYVESSITGIDGLLHYVRHEVQENIGMARNSDLAEWAHRGPLRDSIVQIGVIDPNGYLVYTSTNQSANPVFVGDRDHFLAHVGTKDDRLYVGSPIRAPTTNLELIPFSRRIIGPDDSFRGVVSVLVRGELFSRFHKLIRVGSQGAVTLLRDGVVLARASADAAPADPVGIDVSQVLPGSGVMSATRVVVSPVDGLTRLIHFRRIKDQPLAVVVSQTEQDYFADYRDTVRMFVLLGGVVSVGVIALALLLIFLARNVERARHRAAISQGRYRRLFESAPVAYQSLDGEGRISAVNAAWEQMFGVAATDACGQLASRFLGEEGISSLACGGCATATAERPARAPLEIRRSDGERRLIVVAGCTQSLTAHGVATSQCVLRDVTDEVAQASKLQASEQRLRGIVENINVATWEVELPGEGFSYVSPQVETMFGYSTQQWRGASFWEEHLHPQDRDRTVGLCLSQVALGADHVIEYRFVKHDGSVAWVRDIIKVLRNAAGAPDRLAGVMIDVTPEKMAAAELAKQHALQRSLLDSIPDVIFFKDLDGVYMGCNQAFAELVGRPESAQIGKTDLDFFDRDTAEFFRARDSEMLASGASRRNEEWVTYPDGRRVLLDTLKAPIVGAHGQVIALIGIGRDITESKRAEEGLLLARSVFESTSEGILVTDPQARILMVNPAFTAITGWSAEDVVGHKPSRFKSGRHPPRFYADMWASLRDHGHWQGEIWNRRKGGDLFVESLTISAVRDGAGTVTRYVALFTDITLRKRQEEKIWRQANFDALTGLANRNLFHDRLDRALVRGRRKQQQVGLMFLDLDRFKWINDTLGHDAGDRLLVEAAQRLNACVREDDTVARLGGDEFTIVLQGLVDQEPLQAVTAKVLEALSRPFVLDGTEQHISASVGLSVFPGDADNTSDLLRNADIAMYQAKAAGRNCYAFYSSQMQAETLARVELEHDLRRAVKSGEFALYYQPVVDADGRELVGAEALLRWQHPTRGLLAPAQFLALAEDCGLTIALGEWVIGEVCQQWRTWDDAGRAPGCITFNLTKMQFRHAGLCGAIARAMALHGVPGGMLSVDLTEALMIGQGEAPLQRLLELERLGLHFSLDDFGTGYSSLTTLKAFPFDTVKIDGSFVARLPASIDDQHLVEAIIFMAHSLDLEVLAEGVESEAQLGFLRELGCDLAQGFLISEPLGAQQFGEFLDSRAQSAGADPQKAEQRRLLSALRSAQLDTGSWVRGLLVERHAQAGVPLAEASICIGKLDVMAAIIDHLDCRARIAAAIRGDGADPWTGPDANSQHRCTLGHWIDGQRDGAAPQLSGFAQMVRRHETFHEIAGGILVDLGLGRRAEARRRIHGLKYRRASHDLAVALIDLLIEHQAATSDEPA